MCKIDYSIRLDNTKDEEWELLMVLTENDVLTGTFMTYGPGVKLWMLYRTIRTWCITRYLSKDQKKILKAQAKEQWQKGGHHARIKILNSAS